MMGAAVSVRILGTVEVWDGERRQELGGGKQLTLLAFFLLHAGLAVSSDAVIDALWGAACRIAKALADGGQSLAPSLAAAGAAEWTGAADGRRGVSAVAGGLPA